MTEDYVSFEVAKLLKEKGFDWECATLYDIRNGEFLEKQTGYVFNNSQWDNFITAPTLQMAMKWLREVCKIGIFPSIYQIVTGAESGINEYSAMIVDFETGKFFTLEKFRTPSYEKTVEQAIMYYLTNQLDVS